MSCHPFEVRTPAVCLDVEVRLGMECSDKVAGGTAAVVFVHLYISLVLSEVGFVLPKIELGSDVAAPRHRPCLSLQW